MQTSQEVIDCLLRGKPAERIGLHDNPWGDTVTKWITQGYPTTDDDKPVNPVDHFGFDMAGVGGWFNMEANLDAGEIIEETDEWKIVRNGNGAALKWWKNKSGTPEHIDFLMTSREVWEKDYRPKLPGSVDKRVTAETIENTSKSIKTRKDQGKWTMMGGVVIWEAMRASMGDVCLYESMLLDPGWIHDFCRVHIDLYKDCYRKIFEKSGKPDGIWIYEDMGYKLTTFCSPETYRDLIFPYFAEVVDFHHSFDLPVVLHTCGFTESLLDLIVDAGFDALNPMEVKAGNNPLRIAKQYKDKLAFIGGLDAVVLESGNRDLIKKEIVTLVEGMKSIGARYVFGSDHSLSTNIDYDDFCFAIDVYREHMAY